MSAALKPWLIAQVIWLVMACLFNLIGIWNMAQGERALIGDTPEVTLIGSLLFGFAILAGFLGWSSLYRYLMPVFFIGLVVIGFISHFVAIQSVEGAARYSSVLSWWSAILINGYGLIVFAGGLYLAWREFLNPDKPNYPAKG